MDIFTFSSDFYENISKLIIAIMLGALLGIEREAHGRSAGLRTNMLLCMSACLLMILSEYLIQMYKGVLASESVIRMDPARIAAYTMSGMGFLGAGVIIKGRGSIRGITTAACLWTNTAIGLSVGAGMVSIAMVISMISYLILFFIRHLERVIKKDIYINFNITSNRLNQLDNILDIIKRSRQFQVKFIGVDNNIVSGKITFNLSLRGKQGPKWQEITDSVSKLKGVEKIIWERGQVP